MLRRSMLIVSGMTRRARYPRTAATAAMPMPVLPEVGSMMVPPARSVPFFSASATIASAARSLTEPAGLKLSSFANKFAPQPNAF